MTIELQLETQASAPRVLAALRGIHGRGVPATLERWTRGSARSVAARVRGRRFRLSYKRGWLGPEYDELEVRGTVESSPTGGAVVRVRTGQKLAAWIAAIVPFGGWATWTAVAGSQDWWMPLGLLAAILLFMKGADEGVSRADDDARYLIECVEQAIADIRPEEGSDDATASPLPRLTP